MRSPIPWHGLVTAALLLTLAGCGYKHQALFPADIRTVAVPIAENRSFYRGVEFQLTEALVKQIELRTPYKVVSAASADSVLTVTVANVGQNMLSRRRRAGLPQEMEVRLVVNFEWKNLRSGQVLRDRRGFEAVSRYVPTVASDGESRLGEPLELGLEQAAQRMASEIVSTMAADW